MAELTTPVLHYAIQGQLGVGGMGVVYRALDTRLGRPVALKFLPESLSVDARAKERLTLEARSAASLDHPNIGVIHDIEEADGRIFIVMSLYEGESLKERLAHQPLPVVDALELAIQACRGLAAAHDRGIIHRDIKPANLFITRDGLLKILDFGLVKLEQSEGLTMPGTIMGTPEYMAPEQIRGRTVDQRADLWALGVVLYEMLTSTSPFRANGELSAIILEVINGRPRPVDELHPGLPPGLGGLLERALAKDREERFGSAQEMAEELRRVLTTLEGAGTAQFPHQTGGQPGVTGRELAAESDGPTSVVDLILERPGAIQQNALLEPVPRADRFIGREGLVRDLLERLESERFVAVRGLAGSGKSMLGAKLAREKVPEENIFWFTFDPVEKNTADSLFWSIAAFLRNCGETLLWRYLQGEIEAHTPLDMTVRMNLFLSSLSKGEYVFCLDDLHLVAAAADVSELIKLLQKHVTRDGSELRVSFILMGRELPTGIDFRAESIGGFSAAEAKVLLAERGVQELPQALANRLFDRTGGNPTILGLCASALSRLEQDSSAQASFIESMTTRGDIRDYVMRHVYADLPENEKAVLDALSIFPSAVELEVAEETLLASGLSGIVPCVDSLIQKAVLQEAGNGQVYCHGLVREYCYRSLELPTKRNLHGHAAGYFEARKNILRAAHHYLELGEKERALELLTSNVQAIIHSGGAASLLDQLSRFDPRTLDEEQQLAISTARGEANFVRGEFRLAVEIYQEALDEVLDDAAEAELLCRIASAFDKLAEHEIAIEHARRSQAAFEALGDEAGVAQVKRVLGWALYRLGRLDDATVEFEAARESAERLEERTLLAQVQQGLGVIDLRSGRLEQARSRLDASRRTFREQRDRIGEAEATGNLAWVFGRLGNVERELALDRKVLEILEHVGDIGNLLIAYNNTADLYFRSGGHLEAIEQYEKLAELAERVEHCAWRVAAQVGLAENSLALGRLDEALGFARAALRIADEAGGRADLAVERAMSSRILGEVLLAMGEPTEARNWFERSIPPLEEAREEEELEKALEGLRAAGAQIEEQALREGEYERT